MRIAGFFVLLMVGAALAACEQAADLGRRPAFTSVVKSQEYQAMSSSRGHGPAAGRSASKSGSLWQSGPSSLLGDRRASTLGDLMTVVIEINDKAEITNSTSRSRSGSENLSLPSLFGIPQNLNDVLPEGSPANQFVDTNSSSNSKGDGAVRRKEKLTLRVAATVTHVLENGYLQIQGTQEVRVNFELRELLVTGFVRPEDISRQNEVTYDRIASARISYGGRGQISSAQQPRIGQQAIDLFAPF